MKGSTLGGVVGDEGKSTPADTPAFLLSHFLFRPIGIPRGIICERKVRTRRWDMKAAASRRGRVLGDDHGGNSAKLETRGIAVSNIAQLQRERDDDTIHQLQCAVGPFSTVLRVSRRLE